MMSYKTERHVPTLPEREPITIQINLFNLNFSNNRGIKQVALEREVYAKLFKNQSSTQNRARLVIGQTLFEAIVVEGSGPGEYQFIGQESSFQESQILENYPDKESLGKFIEEGGIKLAKKAANMNFKYDSSRDIWIGNSLHFVFFDNVSEIKKFPLDAQSLLSELKNTPESYTTLLIPFSAADQLIPIGFVPDDYNVWAKQTNDSKYKEVRDRLLKTGIIEHNPFRAQVSLGKLWFKNFISSHNLQTPHFEMIKEEETTVVDVIDRLLEKSTEQTVYLKDTYTNNGDGIAQIRRVNDRQYSITIPSADDNKSTELQTFLLSAEEITAEKIKKLYKERGYQTNSDFWSLHYFESGIKRLQIGNTRVEFRVNIVDDSPDGFTYRARIVPSQIGEYRSNMQIGGTTVSQEELLTFIQGQTSDTVFALMTTDRINEVMTAFVKEVYTKLDLTSNISDSRGISFDVILDNFIPFILEWQGMEADPSLLRRRIEIMQARKIQRLSQIL